jgi:hypothetical protein
VAGPLRAEGAGDTPKPKTVAHDPNERICEDIVQTGSRIAAKHFCATRAEWEDKKRQDREAVEKAQLSPCMLTHNGGTGKATC